MGKSWYFGAISGDVCPAAPLGGNLSTNAVVKLLENPVVVHGYFKSVLLVVFFLLICSVLKPSREALGVSFPLGDSPGLPTLSSGAVFKIPEF